MIRTRRRWLFALPLLLLSVALLVRWRTPRPSSPANAWLWEQGERLGSVSSLASASEFGIKSDKEWRYHLVIKDRAALRQLLRTLNCSGDFSKPPKEPLISFGLLSWRTASTQPQHCVLMASYGGRRYYIARGQSLYHMDQVAPLHLSTMPQVRALLRKLAMRARQGDKGFELGHALRQ